MSAYDDVRRHLADQRKRIGRSQADVGRTMGCTQSAVSELESGNVADPGLNTIARWAAAVDLELELHFVERVRTVHAIKPRFEPRDDV